MVGFRDNRLIVMPFSDTQGVRPGSAVFPRGRAFNVPVGPSLLGRVIDGMAQPIDGLGPLGTIARYPVTNQPPDPLSRRPIRERLSTGVRAIDGMLTCGKGQRIGIGRHDQRRSEILVIAGRLGDAKLLNGAIERREPWPRLARLAHG